MTSASVKKGTGKSWDQWIEILDRLGAREMTHRNIVLHLQKKYRLTPWWQQGVTLGYEIHIGRRVEGQNGKGLFTTTTTKTLKAPASAVWKWLNSAEGQSLWLKPLSEFKLKPKAVFETEEGVFGEVRTMLVNRRARLRWQEDTWERPSILQIYLVPRKNGTCILCFTHENLATGRLRLQMRDYWRNVVSQIDL